MVHRLIASRLSNKNEPQAVLSNSIDIAGTRMKQFSRGRRNYSLVMAPMITRGQARRCIRIVAHCIRAGSERRGKTSPPGVGAVTSV